MPLAERTMWKDIERHFLTSKNNVWINPVTMREIVDFIPDVVIAPKTPSDKIEITSVEVKRTLTQENFSKALGQCVRSRKFATRLYLAAYAPIPQWAIRELSIVAGEIGILADNESGSIREIKKPSPIEQTNTRLLKRILTQLSTRTRRWRFGVTRKRIKLHCNFCQSLFDEDPTLDRCPNCGTRIQIASHESLPRLLRCMQCGHAIRSHGKRGEEEGTCRICGTYCGEAMYRRYR